MILLLVLLHLHSFQHVMSLHFQFHLVIFLEVKSLNETEKDKRF